MSAPIINQLLSKIGVAYKDLNEEERDTFNGWREALTGRKLTDEDVRQFIDFEFTDSVKKLSNSENSKDLDTFLKMKVDFITKVKDFLALPDSEKKMAEHQIANIK